MIPGWTLAMMETGETAPTFSPLDLGSKLLVWWAPPQDGVNVTTSSGAIADWTDEVSAYVMAQSTAGDRPAYDASSFNGVACAEFDGSGDYLDLTPVPAGIPSGSDSSEFWVVCRQDADGSSDSSLRRLVSEGGGTSAGWRELRRDVNSGTDNAVARAGGDSDTNSADFSGYHVVRGVFDSEVRCDVDGSAGSGTSTTMSTNTTRIAFGVNPGLTGNTWKGAIRQVLITEPLTTGEAADLLAYLNQDL